MNWTARQHPVETLAEWGAPALLAAAAGWAARSAGLPNLMMVLAIGVAFSAGLLVMRAAGGHAPALRQFEPAGIESVEFDELLLEAKDEVLILDDPLVEVAADSRVVRLFAGQEPTPGELVERIADFLGDGRGAAASDQARAEAIPPADATAALHTALANIRASLR